jgi:UDP-N-acetylmuramyl pentapeptide phosphotransferase/UDP-N-acetylglucosamine-1-phosphate transferase
MSLLVPFSAFVISWLVLAWLLRRGGPLPMDHPNARSLHATPMPRVGGLGIMAGTLVAAVRHWWTRTCCQVTLGVVCFGCGIAAR